MVERQFSWDERAIILSFIAISLSIITVIITELKPVNKTLLKINHKSIHNDIWLDVVDYKKGTTLRIVCEDAIYIGVLYVHEEKGNESWFVLDDYIIEENNKENKAEDNEYPTRLAINIKDVKRIELFYPKVEPKEKKISLLILKKAFNKIFNVKSKNKHEEAD